MGCQPEKLKLALWKNWIQVKRCPVVTICRLTLLPFCFSILLIVQNSYSLRKNPQIAYPPFSPSDTNSLICTVNNNTPLIAYSPKSPLLLKITSAICDKAEIIEFISEIELNDHLKNNRSLTRSLSFALQFSDELSGLSNNQEFPQKLEVILRLPSVAKLGKVTMWYTNLLYPSRLTSAPRGYQEAYSFYGGEPYYKERGFLHLQHNITFGLINNGEPKDPEVKIELNRFPFPEWIDNSFYKLADILISPIILISLFFNYIIMTFNLTTEKQEQLIDLMYAMGMPRWCIWTSWFLRNVILLFIPIVLVVLITTTKLFAKNIFSHSSLTVLLTFFILYGCCTIMLSSLTAAFFTNAGVGTLIGGHFFIIMHLPAFILQLYSIKAQFKYALVLSLLAPSAMVFGISVIVEFESIGEGVHWKNLGNTPSPTREITLRLILSMLVFDAVLYFALAWYVSMVYRGRYGRPHPWYFLCSPNYWKTTFPSSEKSIPTNVNSENFEEIEEKLPVGLQLVNLSKTFKTHHSTKDQVVKNLNLDVYEGQITVLVGHNDSGKSTTLSMIAGMYPPSNGTILINGYDVRTERKNISKIFGYCPQTNILFKELTVQDHLYFFGKLKGMEDAQIYEQMDSYLEIIGLETKKHLKAEKLSEGLKRKLNVGVALLGESKVLVLDEPTAGVDSRSRRNIWTFLRQQKKNRTILLATQNWDEADTLGDRIAVIIDGELKCCGSSFFLKQKFAKGYDLTIDVGPKCKPEKITNLLKNHIPFVKIHSFAGAELKYRLLEEDFRKFENMLKDLDNNKKFLHILSYGINVAPLDGVFVNNPHKKNDTQYQDDSMTPKEEKINRVESYHLLKNQLIAIFLKKFLYSFRLWYLFVFIIVFFLPTSLISNVLNNPKFASINMLSPLKISLDVYESPVTLLSGTPNRFSFIYEQILQDHLLKKEENISTEILKLTSNFLSYFRKHYIVAASFSKRSIVGWFNGDAYHSSPLALSLVLNTFYKKHFGEEYLIEFSNHPLPPHLETQLTTLRLNAMGNLISVALMPAIAILTSFFSMFCIKERVRKAKLLQMTSGVNAYIFWIVCFICDLIICLIAICVLLITLAILQEEGFQGPETLALITIVLVIFFIFAIPFIYLMSYMFKNPHVGIIVAFLFSLLLGVITPPLLRYLELIGRQDLAQALEWFLLFIPSSSFTMCVYKIGKLYTIKKVCSQYNSLELACTRNSKCCGVDNYFTFHHTGIGRNIMVSVVRCFVFLGMLIFADEYDYFTRMNYFLTKNRKFEDVALEKEVQEENDRIRNTEESVLRNNFAVVFRDATKYYKDLVVVNGLCFGVKPYECFGLVGLNGAGKSTTIGMMTGDVSVSYGDGWINGFSIKSELKKIYKRSIGYCPQTYAFFTEFTVGEILYIFALIRGIALDMCKTVKENLAKEFEIFDYLDERVKSLSIANRRKLSVAIALIGDPPILFLDEPTKGMDPASKRTVWSVLSKLRDKGKCIVLTSHSMEECKALCTKFAIMVNGNFRYIGSTQELKSKFGQSYSLTIRVQKADDVRILNERIRTVDKFVRRNFEAVQLQDRYQEMLYYELRNISVPLSQIFGTFENNKRALFVESYSLDQCSLNQIFLNLTMDQQSVTDIGGAVSLSNLLHEK